MMRSFTWEKFNTDFMKAVLMHPNNASKYQERLAKNPDSDSLAGMMLSVCDYPDTPFVKKYRREIEDYLFPIYKSEVRKICNALTITGKTYPIMLENLKKKVTTQSLIEMYIRLLLNIADMDVPITEYSKFFNTVSLDMAKTQYEEVPLYDFQKDAVNALRKFYIDQNKEKGLFVMPTGSGKTRTSTYFLISEMISAGYQILWIAHRHMLLDQAAECFYDFAGLAKVKNPNIKSYHISCVSGAHLSCSKVEKGDEVVVASISSISRNKPHLNRILGQKVMIVVDEAHHALAPSYRETIKYVQSRTKTCKLLGVTATPVRANEKDSATLRKIFGNEIIYEAYLSNLIAQGFLAAPKPERVYTGESFEDSISSYEKSHIDRFGELPESLIDRIAQSKQRNKFIVNHYLKNKDKYGKTLIFALNQIHCRTLAEELQENGIKCDTVYSGKDKDEDNNVIIKKFKENQLDVLTNVNIMTEGTDVPDIQTVFLTRPTQSEGLLMQMIGRGLRGPKAGGTKTAFIVDFHDQWSKFNKWLNPKWILADEDPEFEEPEYKKYSYVEIEWRICQEIYREMEAVAAQTNSYLSVPYGWYSLIDEEGNDCRVLIFDDQRQGYDALIRDEEIWKAEKGFDAQKALERYFNYFCNRPSERDVELMMYNLIENEEDLELAGEVDKRELVEPLNVEREAEEKGEDLLAYAEKVFNEQPIAQDLYGDVYKYQEACSRARIYRDNPIRVGGKVEEVEFQQIDLNMEHFYNLDELVKEVIDEMFNGEFDGYRSIEWTKRPMKTYFGIHNYPEHDILINRILDSKDVPREVVKYIIYHEMLHTEIIDHNKAFRALEHKYPDWEELDHFLDTMFRKYDISIR